MTRTDHGRRNQRDHMRRVGVEGIRGALPADLQGPRQPSPNKAELRVQADRAFAEWRGATRASS